MTLASLCFYITPVGGRAWAQLPAAQNVAIQSELLTVIGQDLAEPLTLPRVRHGDPLIFSKIEPSEFADNGVAPLEAMAENLDADVVPGDESALLVDPQPLGRAKKAPAGQLSGHVGGKIWSLVRAGAVLRGATTGQIALFLGKQLNSLPGYLGEGTMVNLLLLRRLLFHGLPLRNALGEISLRASKIEGSKPASIVNRFTTDVPTERIPVSPGMTVGDVLQGVMLMRPVFGAIRRAVREEFDREDKPHQQSMESPNAAGTATAAGQPGSGAPSGVGSSVSARHVKPLTEVTDHMYPSEGLKGADQANFAMFGQFHRFYDQMRAEERAEKRTRGKPSKKRPKEAARVSSGSSSGSLSGSDSGGSLKKKRKARSRGNRGPPAGRQSRKASQDARRRDRSEGSSSNGLTPRGRSDPRGRSGPRGDSSPRGNAGSRGNSGPRGDPSPDHRRADSQDEMGRGSEDAGGFVSVPPGTADDAGSSKRDAAK